MKKMSKLIFLMCTLFTLRKTQDPLFTIGSKNHSGCIDYQQSDQVNSCNSNESQRFYYTLITSTTIQMKNFKNNLCISQSALNSSIGYTTCADNKNQFWEIIPKSGKGFNSIRIKNVLYQQCMSLYRSPSSSSDLVNFKTCIDINNEDSDQNIKLEFQSTVPPLPTPPPPLTILTRSKNALTKLSKVSGGNCGEKIEYSGIKTANYSKDHFYQIDNANNILKYNKNRYTKPFSEKAKEITISKNGTIHIITEDSKLKKHNGTTFTDLSKTALRLSTTPEGNPWIIDKSFYLHSFDGTDWSPAPEDKRANEISIGADGTVWCLAYDDGVDVGYGIWRLNGAGSNWERVVGRALKIAVGIDGHAWIVNNKNVVFEFNGHGWDKRFDGVTDISVGVDGAVMVVGTETGRGGFNIHKYDEC